MWRDQQHDWADGLLNPALSPVGIVNDRFAIHRNNVIINLRETLRATYPVVDALIGEDGFDDIAGEFIHRDPPRSPVLIDYGGSFADFLATHDLAAEVPYLADVARLEWLRHEAFHAADAAPVGIAGLADVPAGDLDAVRLTVHPSMRLFHSDWPAMSIWNAHQHSDIRAALASLPSSGETALVMRPALDVEVRLISSELSALLAALLEGRPLGEAIAAAAAAGPRDISTCLESVFSLGAIVGMSRPCREEGEIS